MIDSTARAERFETGFAASPAYTWTVPQKPVSVRIPHALIDKLEREAVESFRSLTSRGSEIGGLLFGSVTPGAPSVVVIQNYEPFVCEYTGGPLYHLTTAELSRLDKLMEQRRTSGALPVGFYRSHTRKGLSLDADDLALFESRFPAANDIVLVVRPSATKASTAGIFIREDGKVQADKSHLEFPFRSSQHEGGRAGESESSPVAGPRSFSAAPAAPRPVVRGQIVPIASRREGVTGVPAAAQERQPEPAVEKASTPVPAPAPPAVTAPPPVAAAPPVAPAPPVVAAPPVAAAPAEKPEAPVRKAPPASEKATPAASGTVPMTAPARAESAPAKPAPAASPDAAPDLAPVEPLPAARSKSGKLLWIGLGAALPLVLVGGFFLSSGVLHLGNRGIPSAGQDSSPLSLRTERNAGDIVLTWNRDSAAIQHATKAVLAISDGPQHENVEMDLAQLRNGSIVYSPVTSDIVFRMEVTGRDQSKTTSESVRVLRTRPSPLDQPTTSPEASVLPPSPAPAAASPQAAPAPSEAQSAAQPEEQKVQLAQAVKPFSADSLARRLRTTRPADAGAPDVPAVVSAPKLNDVNLGGLGGTTIAPPSAAIPAPEKKAAPVSGGQLQQAELVFRKAPEYPKLARDSGASGVVEVTATIGVDGRVKAVKVIKGHPLLRQAAVDAVRQWIYKPTILNGTAVEAQTQVLLNFKSDR